MSEKKELKAEELNQVTGGSHVKPSKISEYIGKNMKFSYGIFGINGPYPVYINNVTNNTVVTMTFTDPNKMPKVNKLKSLGWKELGNNAWEWDYDDHSTTWLE